MAFTLNLSGTSAVNDSLIQAYDRSFIVAFDQENVMDQFVEYKAEIGAKNIQFPKFSQLSLVTSPLTETDDVTSEAMVDEQVLLTPAEYGQAVTRTSLASLQSGGKVDVAAARLVGLSLARSKNKLATLALDASTNVFIANGKTLGGSGTLAATDIADTAFLDTAYNKLARANIPGVAGQEYIMIAHDDVISDLRTATGLGSWTDVAKYSTPETVLKNEVGMYKGFRVVRNNHATITANGSGTVDVYNTYFVGFNGLGLAESKTPGMVATGPFDKLARFVNLGWYGVFGYSIIDKSAVWVGQSASSRGANAA